MKLYPIFKTIIDSYNLQPIELPNGYKNVYQLLRENPVEKENYHNDLINDTYLLNKYDRYITKGHYGFSIGDPVIPEWYDILDKILEICVKNDPNFEIHQVKMKFGGIRFYCDSKVIEDMHEIEMLIMQSLHDKALIY